MNSPRRNKLSAFSLVELLTVMGVITMLAMATTPAIRSLTGASSVNKAIADSSRVLELARVYAMANNTHVRVAFAELAPQGGRMNPSTLMVSMCSASGSLGADSDMADSSKWPLINKPLILQSFVVDDELNASSPATAGDVTPSGANRQGTAIAAVSRQIPGAGNTPIAFSSYIQFSPSGESRVARDEPARYIKVAFDEAVAGGKNPFILRLSGGNGGIAVLRKEDGI